MRLFDRKRRSFNAAIGIMLMAVLLAACGTTATTSTSTPTTSAPVNGKGCTKIGVLLPETATSARWDANDRPALLADIPQQLPGATVDYNNAQGSADTQQ